MPRIATSFTSGQIAKRRLYRARRRKKLCASCERPARGSAFCHRCAARSQAHQAKLAAARLLARLCRECGWPCVAGSRCMTCRLKRKSRPSRQAAYRNQREYDRHIKRPSAARRAA